MIKVEEDSQEQGKRNSQEDISHIDIPKVDKPAPIHRREESLAGRQRCDIDISHMTDMDEPRKEDNRQRRTIILQELSHVALEQIAVP